MENDVLRTVGTLQKYFAYLDENVRTPDLRDLPMIFGGNKWVVVENQFPYDKIAKTHHMLVPLRAFTEDIDMTQDERDELAAIKRRVADEKLYDVIMENVMHRRTVPTHYHLHLIKYKDITTYARG